MIFEEEQRDSLLEGVDLLELLCRLGREYEIQVFALADPAVLTKKAATEKNSEMDSLTACCADLLRRYPIAGWLSGGELGCRDGGCFCRENRTAAGRAVAGIDAR